MGQSGEMSVATAFSVSSRPVVVTVCCCTSDYFRAVALKRTGGILLGSRDTSALNYIAEVSGAEVSDGTSAPICMRHFGTTVYLYRPYIVMHFVLYVAR